MPSETLLGEIVIHDYERDERLVDPHLDFPYIAGLASDIAALLHTRSVAECAYQPGDGTSYRLVFVPLVVLQHGRGHEYRGRTYDHHAVAGMANPERPGDESPGYRYYDPRGYLICWIDNAVYPLRLGDRSAETITYPYIQKHWKSPGSSAVALAVLFRAISIHLDRLDPPPLTVVPS